MASPRELGNLGDAAGTTAPTTNVTIDVGTFFVDGTNNRVGISTTSPDATLTVTGTANVSGNFTLGGALNSTSSQIAVGTGQNEEKRVRLQNANRDVYFYLNGTTLGLYDVTGSLSRWTTDTSGNFTAAGNITAYSDARLKENVETITDALEKVNNLRGVSYIQKQSGKAGIGVIAQEVQSVIPQVVEENGEYLSVAYGNLVGLLIEAVKELSKNVNTLRAEIDQLKGD